MVKVTKEFWVSDGFIEQMNMPVCELPGLTRSSFKYPIEKLNTGDKHSAHKITISYEVDREVIIKESDFEKICDKEYLGGKKFKDTSLYFRLKEGFFGGGENE